LGGNVPAGRKSPPINKKKNLGGGLKPGAENSGEERERGGG